MSSVSFQRLSLFLSLALLLISTQLNQVQAKDDYNYVTCGSVFKLANSYNSFRLHSHDVKYGSGSGQQSVTGTQTREDVNSYWAVKGPADQMCSRGEPIKCGSSVRFEHLQTKKNLHSHYFKSPISGNQEVSAYGKDGEGDSGDVWTVVCNDEFWEQDSKIRLKHVDTDMYLALSGQKYGRPISGQAEVVGISYADSTAYWTTEEGAYIKPVEGQQETSKHEEL